MVQCAQWCCHGTCLNIEDHAVSDLDRSDTVQIGFEITKKNLVVRFVRVPIIVRAEKNRAENKNRANQNPYNFEST